MSEQKKSCKTFCMYCMSKKLQCKMGQDYLGRMVDIVSYFYQLFISKRCRLFSKARILQKLHKISWTFLMWFIVHNAIYYWIPKLATARLYTALILHCLRHRTSIYLSIHPLVSIYPSLRTIHLSTPKYPPGGRTDPSRGGVWNYNRQDSVAARACRHKNAIRPRPSLHTDVLRYFLGGGGRVK